MGKIADLSSMKIGFVLTLIGFAVVALYGLFWQRLSGHRGSVTIKAGGALTGY